MIDFTWNLQTLSSCTSTNSELKRLLQTGEAGIGSVLISERQSDGRGRMDRRWISPVGNIALSAACPSPDDVGKIYQLNLLAGLSLARAIIHCTKLVPQIKWPNDVLIGDKKVAGILSEVCNKVNPVMRDAPLAVIIGVGVNFNSSKTDFPVDLQGSLKTVRDNVSFALNPVQFIHTFLTELKMDLLQYAQEGLAELSREMNNMLAYKNTCVEITESGSQTYRATLLGLDQDGFLNARVTDGTIKTVIAADVRSVVS